MYRETGKAAKAYLLLKNPISYPMLTQWFQSFKAVVSKTQPFACLQFTLETLPLTEAQQWGTILPIDTNNGHHSPQQWGTIPATDHRC